MHEDPHIARSLREATPEAQPPSEFDLDRIVEGGRRLRRRGRIAVGAAAAAGVVAAVSAVALVLTLSPGTEPAPADDAETADAPPEEDPAEEVTDPAMAGYPHSLYDQWGSDEESAALEEAATAAFSGLLIEAGLAEAEVFETSTPSEEEVRALMEELDVTEDEAVSFLAGDPSPLRFRAEQYPGNEGQVYLRQYQTGLADEVDGRLRPTFSIAAVLPGGWTAEPGPVTQHVFPQHLISDGARYTDRAPEFDATELEDGRTVMVADHGCAYDLAVVYPNGSALKVSWDVDCTGRTYPVDLGVLTDAVLSMPEIDFETGELAPIGVLWEVPAGWPYDPEWEAEAAGDAQATTDLAREALSEVMPGSTVGDGTAIDLAPLGRGEIGERSYGFSGTLPFETTVDASTGPVYYTMRYYLPGGWIPGYGEVGNRGEPYLLVCRANDEYDDVCDETEVDGRRVARSEMVTEYEPLEGEPADWAYTETEYEVIVFDPDGWAVGIWLSYQGDIGLDLEQVTEIAAAMPAPVYDEDARPVVPAG
ncbi:hypothetical protein GCM10027447_07700 [Glycomyces halotolerans]